MTFLLGQIVYVLTTSFLCVKSVIYQLLQAVITRLMHPEVINIRYFWIRFAIAAFGICGYAISMTGSGQTGSYPYKPEVILIHVKISPELSQIKLESLFQ